MPGAGYRAFLEQPAFYATSFFRAKDDLCVHFVSEILDLDE